MRYNRVKVFCLSCDAKDCKHYTFPFKIHKSSVKENRRLRTKCDWLSGPCVVEKVECRKLPVVKGAEAT